MSEYQYYEFRCIDKPLSQKQQQTIGQWSSRTNPTSTGAVFVYNYGDFPRDEKDVVKRYFDAMFYIANWGSTRLIFKFPAELINLEEIRPYCTFDEISVTKSAENVLLDFRFSDEEGEGWIEDEGWLSSLIGLRNDILKGDYRSLYLAWAHACWLHNHWEDVEDDIPEAPVPDRLNTLNGALKSFVEVLDIDQDLLSVITKTKGRKKREAEPNIESMIKHLSDREKNDFLIRILKDEPHLSVKLKQKLQTFAKTKNPAPPQESTTTIDTMLREAAESQQRRKEAERKKREAKKRRTLKKLESEEGTLWNQVDQHIAKKDQKAYDVAIEILQQLHTLAKHKNAEDAFEQKVRMIMKKYSRLSSLKSKIVWAKLIRNQS